LHEIIVENCKLIFLNTSSQLLGFAPKYCLIWIACVLQERFVQPIMAVPILQNCEVILYVNLKK